MGFGEEGNNLSSKVFSLFPKRSIIFYQKTAGGVPDSIGSVRGGLHVEDDRWPRKTSIKTIIANEQYALAA